MTSAGAAFASEGGAEPPAGALGRPPVGEAGRPPETEDDGANGPIAWPIVDNVNAATATTLNRTTIRRRRDDRSDVGALFIAGLWRGARHAGGWYQSN